MAQKFELSLSIDYVKHWGAWEAVREIWQNALDYKKYTYTWTSRELDGKPNILRIISRDVALEKNTLLLGKSTKSDDDSTIGQFGEGYKLACLVLARMGKTVTIYNACRNEIWRPKIVKSRRYKDDILTMFIEKHIYEDMFDDDLTFEIEGITRTEWEEITEKNLHVGNQLDRMDKIETGKGDILLKTVGEERKPTVYVNGLCVSEIPVKGYRYSYNIKPKYITLDRDRRCVEGFKFKWLTSDMWKDVFTEKREVIINMIENKVPDVAYIDSHISYNNSVRHKIAEAFIQKHGVKAIAVCNDEGFKAVKREHGSLAEPVIVSDSYHSILKSSSIYRDNINTIPKRKQGVGQKPPITILKDTYNKLYDYKIEDFDVVSYKEFMAKEFNKLINMSSQWRWK